MMALVSVRQIKPGQFEQFREAWQPDPWPGPLSRALVLRHQDDPDRVVTIGFIEGGPDDVDRLRDDPEILRQEERRLQRMSEFEEEVLLSGIYELADEVLPPGSS